MDNSLQERCFKCQYTSRVQEVSVKSSNRLEQLSYKYQRLEPGQFRVFALLAGQPEDPVRVEIRHWHVDRDRGYAALSYSWGDAADEKPVYVGSKIIWIRHNLWIFLKRLRQTDDVYMLWADAICIDQKKEQEKSTQIGLMTYIYPQASRVICWLGEDGDDIDIAFNLLKRWSRASNTGAERLALAAEMRSLNAQSQKMGTTPLAKMCSRSWFRRAWVVQEICVDVSKLPTVLCGPYEIGWREMVRGFTAIYHTIGLEGTAVAAGSQCIHLLDLIFITAAPADQFSLSRLMGELMTRREATLPEDKILSVLGLAARHGYVYPPPDVRLTTARVCIMYSRAMIESDGCLDILSMTRPSWTGADLPSWVIKLRGGSDATDVVEHPLRLGQVHTVDLPGRQAKQALREAHVTHTARKLYVYHAALDLPPFLLDSRDSFDGELRLRGTVADRVQSVYSLQAILHSRAQDWCSLWQQSKAFCDRLGQPLLYKATNETLTEAFMRTLCGNMFYLIADEENVDLEVLHSAYLDHISSKIKGSSNVLPHGVMTVASLHEYAMRGAWFQEGIPGDLFTTSDESLLEPEEGWLGLRLCEHYLPKIKGVTGPANKLIVTTAGRIGLAGMYCEADDEVVLFPGSSVPVVMRRNSKHSETGDKMMHVVSNAYVHGIMHGEGMQDFAVARENLGEEAAVQQLTIYCIS